ncbi:MAG: hypothetical protein Ct9H300mP1_30600 [Planctomycetaceae bacterium]|nr:MAG: hypothetical protein Ct9H300mP1_30600 [Planctomycetaceae bacterium]
MLSFVLACVVPPMLLSVTATGLLRSGPGLGTGRSARPRKVHETVTPMGGGIAVWFSVVTPLAA